METICQQCGDKGLENAFVYCVKCLNFAVHRYCLPKLPETFDEFVCWLCEDCKPKSAKQTCLDKPCYIPSTERDHVIPERGRLTHSQIKLKKKDVACRGPETEEHGRLSSPSHQPCDAKAKLDLIKHSRLVCDCPITVTENGHQSNPSQCSPESYDKLSSTDHAQLVSDCSLPKMKLKMQKGVTCNMAEIEDQRQQSGCSQPHCETQTKLDLTEHAQLAGDCSTLKMKLKRKKRDVAPSITELRERKHQSIPSQRPGEAHTEHALCADSTQVHSSSPLNENRTIHPCNENRGDDLELGKQKRLILEEGSKFGKEVESIRIADSPIGGGNWSNMLEHNHHLHAIGHNYYLHAQPVIDPIWRGNFRICSKDSGLFDGVVAHLSSKACPKVCEEAGLLPPFLCLEMLPKTALWPKSFQRSQPRDENIALYFFPGSKRYERVFDNLVDDMMHQDLAMRAMVTNAELLVFTSSELPLLYWKFQGKHYLWGVFRKKQTSSSPPVHHHLVEPNSNAECVPHSSSANSVGTGEERNLTKTKTLDAWSPLSPLSNNSSSG